MFSQIGIKEIHHQYWKSLYKAFPKMKVILTGRDPRDIYISLHHRNKTRKHPIRLNGQFCPETVAENLLQDFEYQKEMYQRKQLDCLKVKYEDFCTNQDIVYAKIKNFVNSPIPDIGEVGSFNAAHPKRISEYNIHGNHITSKKVYRWRKVSNQKLLEEAQQVFDLLLEYSEFWGYER